MRSPTAITAGLAAALLLGACGPPSADTSGTQMRADRAATERVALIRDTLGRAVTAAQAYGQAHLGHYLDLSIRDLRREGLVLPEGITISAKADHSGYCIRASDAVLPSIHPWAEASASSADREPSPEDRCQGSGGPIRKG